MSLQNSANRCVSRRAKRPSIRGSTTPSPTTTPNRSWRSRQLKRPGAPKCASLTPCSAAFSPPAPVFDFRAHFCHSAPMEMHAFGFRLRANAPEGQKAISYQFSKSLFGSGNRWPVPGAPAETGAPDSNILFADSGVGRIAKRFGVSGIKYSRFRVAIPVRVLSWSRQLKTVPELSGIICCACTLPKRKSVSRGSIDCSGHIHGPRVSEMG